MLTEDRIAPRMDDMDLQYSIRMRDVIEPILLLVFILLGRP